MIERIREQLNSMRLEADTAIGRAEKAEANVKQLQEGLLSREQDITGLEHRLSVLETENEKLQEFKASSLNSDVIKTTVEILTRKVQILEEELDAAEKNYKETAKKLRQVDERAEHYERQAVRAEMERDTWENKYENLNEKYRKAQTDLDDLVKTMQDKV